MSDYAGPILQVVGAVVSAAGYPMVGQVLIMAGPCEGPSVDPYSYSQEEE